MKKAAIAGWAVALGVIWSGTAWYTGQKTEAFVKQLIEDSNAKLRNFGEEWNTTVAFELTSFERGVFSSTAHYRMTFSLPAKEGQPAQTQAIPFIEHLDHGPFPLSNLTQGKLAPAMVASRFQIEPSPAINDWFTATKGVTPLSGAYSISYGKQVAGTFNLAPIDATANAATLTFSGMAGDFTFDTNTKHSVLALKSEGLTVSEPFSERSMAIKGITLNSDMAPGKNDMMMGSQTFAVKEWTLAFQPHPPVRIKDTRLAVNLTETEAGVNNKMALDFGMMINVQEKDVLGLQLALAMKNLDSKAFKALNDVYERASRRMLRNGNALAPEFTPEEQQAFETSIEQLLAGNPSLSVSPLQVRTANGTSTFDLDADLTKPASTRQSSIEVVRKLDAKLVLSKSNLADLMTIEPQIHGMPVDLQTARAQATLIASIVTAMDIAKEENDNIVSYLNYADGLVDFNGKKMPLQQFMMIISDAINSMR